MGASWSGSRFHSPSIARSLPITGEHPPLGGEVRAPRRPAADKACVTSFEQRIAAEASTWADDGLVSREQADAIRARYLDTERVRRRDRFVQTLAFVGTIGIGLGVILFFAANWDAIPRFARLAVLVAGIVAFYVGGDRLSRSRPRIGHALLLLGCLLFGASLFLVGQMFNVSPHQSLAFLLWTAAAAAGAVILRSEPFAALAAITFAAWIVYELAEAEAGEALVVALPVYGVALYAGGTRLGLEVLRGLGAATVVALLFPLTFGDVGDEAADAATGGTAAVALAAALALMRGRATAPWEAGACVAVVALLGVATAVDVGPLVANVALVALALGAVAAGYAAEGDDSEPGEPRLAARSRRQSASSISSSGSCPARSRSSSAACSSSRSRGRSSATATGSSGGPDDETDGVLGPRRAPGTRPGGDGRAAPGRRRVRAARPAPCRAGRPARPLPRPVRRAPVLDRRLRPFRDNDRDTRLRAAAPRGRRLDGNRRDDVAARRRDVHPGAGPRRPDRVRDRAVLRRRRRGARARDGARRAARLRRRRARLDGSRNADAAGRALA